MHKSFSVTVIPTVTTVVETVIMPWRGLGKGI
jgi:hypothetical protein